MRCVVCSPGGVVGGQEVGDQHGAGGHPPLQYPGQGPGHVSAPARVPGRVQRVPRHVLLLLLGVGLSLAQLPHVPRGHRGQARHLRRVDPQCREELEWSQNCILCPLTAMSTLQHNVHCDVHYTSSATSP